MPLTKTASAHSKVFRRRRADVFVDETDRPVRGHIGRDQQQALRRHEGLDAVGQRIGVFERAERRRVARKDAQDPPHSSLCLQLASRFLWRPPTRSDLTIKHATGWATNLSTLWQRCQPTARSNGCVSLRRAGRIGPPHTISREAKSGSNRRYGRQADGRHRQGRRGTASRRTPAPVSGRTDRGHRAHRGTRSIDSSA